MAMFSKNGAKEEGRRGSVRSRSCVVVVVVRDSARAAPRGSDMYEIGPEAHAHEHARALRVVLFLFFVRLASFPAVAQMCH